MGTSVSSPGPRSGVRLVPPWVSDPDSDSEPDSDDSPIQSNGQDVGQEEEGNSEAEQDVASPIAPPYRFRGTNLNMNRFASSGSINSLKLGLGLYVRKGLGGSHWASERMVSTTRRAGSLYGVLHALGRGESPTVDLGIDIRSLAGRPVREILDRVVEALSPSSGSLGSEESRNSIFYALSRLIREDPTANLVALTTEQIDVAIELFIGEEICRRIELDVGVTILDKAPSVLAGIRRMEEMNRYVQQAVSFAFRLGVSESRPITRLTVTGLVTRVIRNVFQIFESYWS